ncbi:MAG: GNAT family N-acetyltransferase [Pseudomonadales bacterium]|nr:GNAT family N-acetyltransferase [Pseudomonadales bacterium]
MNTKSDRTKFKIKFLSGLDQINSDNWNRLTGLDYPFLRYEFLAALETSGCVAAETGWQPQHLLVYIDDQLMALMPLYVKTHSYGEYVFDWAWAEAYHRHGVQYYPKLLTAIPFTPATGSRLCIAPGQDRQYITRRIVEAIKQQVEEKGYSSWHLLFPQKNEFDSLSQCQLAARIGCQYHWFNRQYSDFNDFLARLSSRKRKNIKRERRLVAEQKIHIVRLPGAEVTEQQLKTFYEFYQATYYKRGQQGYLNLDFFTTLLTNMPEQLLLVLAYRENQPIAGALCLKSCDTLYGRYWGCLDEYECLHFEACYYQGIEYCIEQGIQKFDPGAQGEHKISRGFEPTTTRSLHWVAHSGFRAAIEDFLKREKDGVDEYMVHASQMLPFKNNS